jgi:diguanylate cyclase (GGDEF)-like protein/PAS domain S-box-containing protein
MDHAKLKDRAFELSTSAIIFADLQGNLIDVNRSFVNMWGYEHKKEVVGRPIASFWEIPQQAEEAVRALYERGSWVGQLVARKKDGTLFEMQVSATTVKNAAGAPQSLMASFADITECEWGKWSPFKDREEYLTLFEKSPVSLWEEDLSDVRAYLDFLRECGVTDFRQHFSSHPEDVARCAAMVKVVDVNEYTLELYGAKSKASLLSSLPRLFSPDSWTGFRESLVALAEGKTKLEIETCHRTLAGERIDISLRWSLAPGCEENWTRAFVSIVDITKMKSRERDLHTLSTRDELTGLHNRRGFFALAEERLITADLRGAPVELFVVDMDNLKWVNDNLGHLEGDHALRLVAQVLQEVFDDSYAVGRIGGDEFGAIGTDAPGLSAELAAVRLLEQLEKLNRRPDRSYRVSVSMGRAHREPGQPCSLDDLMALADRDMYEQKRWQKANCSPEDGASGSARGLPASGERRQGSAPQRA